jgi:hypothetical protein
MLKAAQHSAEDTFGLFQAVKPSVGHSNSRDSNQIRTLGEIAAGLQELGEITSANPAPAPRFIKA